MTAPTDDLKKSSEYALCKLIRQDLGILHEECEYCEDHSDPVEDDCEQLHQNADDDVEHCEIQNEPDVGKVKLQVDTSDELFNIETDGVTKAIDTVHNINKIHAAFFTTKLKINIALDTLMKKRKVLRV